MTFMLKRYAVDINGFPTVYFNAADASKARAKAFRAYQSYDDQATFKRFLQINTIRRAPKTPHYGEPILAMGEPAYYVGQVGENVVFARPGELHTMTSHPLDVHLPWKEKPVVNVSE